MRWTLHSNVGDVLALGPRTAGRLRTVGIETVQQLVTAKPPAVAQRLGAGSITAEVLAEWQREAALLLDAPQLSSDAARLLAAAGFRCPEKISRYSPTELLATIEAAQQEHTADWFAETTLPTITEVSQWIHATQSGKKSQAA